MRGGPIRVIRGVVASRKKRTASGEPGLVAFHRIDAFGFTALFYFDRTGLQAVNLMLNDARAVDALYDWRETFSFAFVFGFARGLGGV